MSKYAIVATIKTVPGTDTIMLYELYAGPEAFTAPRYSR